MSLTIQTTIMPVGVPSLDSTARLVQLMTLQGQPVPSRGTITGLTIPFIRFDHSGLNYHTRHQDTEFRFNTGTLQLALRQEVHLLSSLNSCSQSCWLQHEQKHVADNIRLMPRVEIELRADQQFSEILISPSIWRPRANFPQIQRLISERIDTIFKRITGQAVHHLDSRQEYQRVERQIRLRCGKVLRLPLRQGMYGKGIDIIQLALNNESPSLLPPLVVDGIFGKNTNARVKEFQKDKELPSNGVVDSGTHAALIR